MSSSSGSLTSWWTNSSSIKATPFDAQSVSKGNLTYGDVITLKDHYYKELSINKGLCGGQSGYGAKLYCDDPTEVTQFIIDKYVDPASTDTPINYRVSHQVVRYGDTIYVTTPVASARDACESSSFLFLAYCDHLPAYPFFFCSSNEKEYGERAVWKFMEASDYANGTNNYTGTPVRYADDITLVNVDLNDGFKYAPSDLTGSYYFNNIKTTANKLTVYNAYGETYYIPTTPKGPCSLNYGSVFSVDCEKESDCAGGTCEGNCNPTAVQQIADGRCVFVCGDTECKVPSGHDSLDCRKNPGIGISNATCEKDADGNSMCTTDGKCVGNEACTPKCNPKTGKYWCGGDVCQRGSSWLPILVILAIVAMAAFWIFT